MLKGHLNTAKDKGGTLVRELGEWRVARAWATVIGGYCGGEDGGGRESSCLFWFNKAVVYLRGALFCLANGAKSCFVKKIPPAGAG